MSRFEVPPELTSLLLDFTVSVLVNKPPDLLEYASQYFSRMHEERRNPGGSSRSPRTSSLDSNHVEDEEEDFSESFPLSLLLTSSLFS